MRWPSSHLTFGKSQGGGGQEEVERRSQDGVMETPVLLGSEQTFKQSHAALFYFGLTRSHQVHNLAKSDQAYRLL